MKWQKEVPDSGLSHSQNPHCSHINTVLLSFSEDVCLHFQKVWSGRKEECLCPREFGSVKSSVRCGKCREWER